MTCPPARAPDRKHRRTARGGERLPAAEVTEQFDDVGGVAVRSLVAGPGSASTHVVLVPGLGALGYLLPTVRALVARGARCTLLDLPGFGTARPRPGAPTVDSVGEWVAAWIRARSPSGRLVLAGHSTGAQGALLAALRVQDERPLAAVVLAGPTVTPSQRSLARLVAAGPAAYRRDSLRELVVVPDLLRAGTDLVRMLRSATADRPEHSVAALRGTLLVTAGRLDTFAPASWLATLAGSAVSATRVHAVQLPGSHNNPYTHPELLATLMVAAGQDGARLARS